MHAESWELDLNSEFRVLTSWISLTLRLSSTIQNACNNKNDLKVGIDFQCSMNMVPKCRAQFMHDWIPAVLSARTRDCRRRPDLIARAENHNSTQPGCHVASRTRSTDLQKMTWYFRSFPVRGYIVLSLTVEFNLGIPNWGVYWVGGCIEDLCFRLGSLVTTRVSARD